MSKIRIEMSKIRTVRDAIDAPKHMTEIQEATWQMMVDAKLTIAEVIAVAEGIKKDAMRRW